MSLQVHVSGGHYQFDGPHTNIGGLLRQSGVYVISTLENGFHKVLDVGESHDVQNRVQNHDRRESWGNHMIDQLFVSAFYCTETDRMLVESAIRQFHNPPCGIR